MKSTSIYVYEIVAVVIILSVATLLITGGVTLAEWVGTLSIVLTFAHAAAANSLKDGPSPHARKFLNHYLISKELSWLLYMILIDAYSGIIGTILFLCYPFWRYYIGDKNGVS